jgi:hypothetical protein
MNVIVTLNNIDVTVINYLGDNLYSASISLP